MTLLQRLGVIAALFGATALTAPQVLAQETATTMAAPVETAPTDTTGDPAEGLLSEDELDELFAPVALYPDALLAQVLLATTYPIDVVKADQFLTKNEGKSAQEMSDLVAAQTWPEPVKGLAAGFPDLLGRMVEHIDWTEQVGDVLIAQTDDALASLQRLRAQAKLNGYLEDNAAMNVEESENGNISISSANPEIVYVPQYTDTVYTTPAPATPVYVTDDTDWDDYLMTGAIVWGGAILIDEIFDDDHWGDYWHGGGGNGNGNHIDWDGDINIDNGIDIGNGIGNGIGDGDRPGLGNGNRPTTLPADLGDGNFGGAVAGGIAGGIAGGALARPGALPADRVQDVRDGNFRPTDASRDAAREKIKAREAAGAGVATLPAAKGKGDRAGLPSTRPATGDRPKLTTPDARPKATTRAATPPKVSKPKTASRPQATSRAAPSRQPSYKPSSGSRAKASSSRGRSSRGGRR